MADGRGAARGEAATRADATRAWAQALLGDAAPSCDELRAARAGVARIATPAGGLPTLRELARRWRADDAGARAARAAHRARSSAWRARAGELARMEYGFLYDDARHLLAIGYNVDRAPASTRATTTCSPRRRGSASFVAIAQGQLPQESWFALGRLLTTAGGEPVLLSWSGSMFEYLMPLLVMPTYENTLLDQTCRAAVQRQIEYGTQRGVPWGISESRLQHGRRQPQLPVPRLRRAGPRPEARPGRGPGDRAVRLGARADGRARGGVREPAAARRRRRSRAATASTRRSTTRRRACRAGRSSAVVRSFMAHHQGMSLLALAYLLLDRPMQRRFESDPLFQATLLLLQERVPQRRARSTRTSPSCADVRARADASRDAGARASPTPTRRCRRCSCCRTAATT